MLLMYADSWEVYHRSPAASRRHRQLRPPHGIPSSLNHKRPLLLQPPLLLMLLLGGPSTTAAVCMKENQVFHFH